MIIHRSFCKELYHNTVAVILVLIAVIVTKQFAHYLKAAAQGVLTIVSAMEIVLLQLPSLLGYFISLAFFLAVLLVLGRRYLDSEMAVLAACGVGHLRVTRILMNAAFFVAVFAAVVSFWMVPYSELARRSVQRNALMNISLDKAIPNQFKNYNDEGVFYAESTSRLENTANNVFLATREEKRGKSGRYAVWDITTAKEMREEAPYDHGDFAVFYNGMKYLGVPGQRDFKVARYQKYGVRLSSLILPAESKHSPSAMSSWALWRGRHHNLDYIAELQWRLSIPLSVLVLTLIAIPLGRVNPRQGKFARWIPALVLYAAYADLLFLCRAWIASGVIPPGLGMWWVHGVFGLIALCLHGQAMGKFHRVRVWCGF